ncbi:MAG: AIPR family protein [Rubrivivax sp.]|nr:AIPR family protein [Rubrivivax sp.]
MQNRPLQYNDEFFKCAVAHAIVFRELEQLVPTQTDWYDGGYRANIVTFTIAKLAQLIAEQGAGGALNVQSIWRTQSISPALSAQLKVVARAMYSVITSPEQGLENVTEWCKKELASATRTAAERAASARTFRGTRIAGGGAGTRGRRSRYRAHRRGNRRCH